MHSFPWRNKHVLHPPWPVASHYQPVLPPHTSGMDLSLWSHLLIENGAPQKPFQSRGQTLTTVKDTSAKSLEKPRSTKILSFSYMLSLPECQNVNLCENLFLKSSNSALKNVKTRKKRNGNNHCSSYSSCWLSNRFSELSKIREHMATLPLSKPLHFPWKQLKSTP